MSDNSSDRYGSMLAVLGDKDDDRGRLFLDDLFSLYKVVGNRVAALQNNMGAIGVHVATKGSVAKKEVAKYYNDLVGRTADFSSGDELKYVQSLGTSTNELEKFFARYIQVVGDVKRGGILLL